MGYVFISYSSKNIESALNVKNLLVKNGIDVWMAPECIEPGMNYTSAIPAAIEGCFAFVLLLSAEAQMSQWVTKELDLALNRHRTIVPFHLDLSKMTDQYDFMLAGCQRIEASSRYAAAGKELLDKLNSLDPNDRYVKQEEQNSMSEGVPVPPPQDHDLEVVVKTINADKASAKKMPKWLPFVIGGASLLLVLSIVTVVVIVNVLGKVGGPVKDRIAGSDFDSDKDNVSMNIDPDGNVTISLGGRNDKDEDSSKKDEDEGKDGKDKDDKDKDGEDSKDDDKYGKDDDSDDDKDDYSGDSSDGSFLSGLVGTDLGGIFGPDGLGGLLGGTDIDPGLFGYTSLHSMKDIKYVNAELKENAVSAGNGHYSKAVVFIGDGETSAAEYVLDKNYDTLIGEFFCPVELKGAPGVWKIYIYADEVLLKEYSITSDTEGVPISLNVSGKRTITIEIERIEGLSTGAMLVDPYLI